MRALLLAIGLWVLLSVACGFATDSADGLNGRAPVEVVGTQLERADARGGE